MQKVSDCIIDLGDEVTSDDFSWLLCLDKDSVLISEEDDEYRKFYDQFTNPELEFNNHVVLIPGPYAITKCNTKVFDQDVVIIDQSGSLSFAISEDLYNKIIKLTNGKEN